MTERDAAHVIVGLSVSDLFSHASLSGHEGNGREIQRLALRCGWCLAIVTDSRAEPPIEQVLDARSLDSHVTGCAVVDILRRWDGGEDVLGPFDTIVRVIDAARDQSPQ